MVGRLLRLRHGHGCEALNAFGGGRRRWQLDPLRGARIALDKLNQRLLVDRLGPILFDFFHQAIKLVKVVEVFAEAAVQLPV